MKELLLLLIGTVFINNLVFTNFVGIESLLEFTKDSKLSKIMIKSLMIITFISSILNYILYEFILKAIGFEVLDIIVYIIVIYIVSIITLKYVKNKDIESYKDVKVYLPFLIANSAVLFTSININKGLSFPEALITSIGVPLALFFMFYLFASIKRRLDTASTPKAFKGFPIMLIFSALAILAISGLNGLV